jgi:hypothetical protein
MTTMTMTTRMKTDSSPGSYAWWPRLLGATIALVLVAAACSSDDDAATATTATSSTAQVTTTATPAPPNPSELLTMALEGYRSGYEFVATIAVNDQEAVVQTGRWLDDASQLTVRSGDGEIEYIVTAAGQWTRLPDGEWEEIDGSPSVSFPLEPMAEPQSVELMASDAGIATVLAIYPAEVMGLSGNPVEAILEFHDSILVGISFTTEVAGNVTESTTSLGPLADATPIVAPTS